MTDQMTILFADVAGSVALHEKLGDHEAHNVIVKCLEIMSTAVLKNNGSVADTIGDEIMCLFSTADAAFDAAQAIQLAMTADGSLKIRIGFHTGDAHFDNGHPFGDTVNVAARLTSLARASQIVTSEESREQLAYEAKSNTRYFDKLNIKGKSKPFLLFEVLWGDEGNQTVMLSSIPEIKEKAVAASSNVVLIYMGTEHIFTDDGAEITVGRTPDCKIQVQSDSVSRSHLTIKFSRNKILLQDHSTNGTYIGKLTKSIPENYEQTHIHRDQFLMVGQGTLGIGEPIGNNNKHMIHFECR